MRLTILILALGLFAGRSVAQQCDIAQTGIGVYNETNTTPAPIILIGQTANFRFTILNEATGNGYAIPANTVTAVFDFPTMAGNIKPYVYAGPPSFVSGYFTWIYDYAAEVLVGTNSREIPAGTRDLDITMRVRGNAAGAGRSNLNITQGKGIADNAVNNFGGARLIVKEAVVPVIKLKEFTVTAMRCDVLLKWSTVAETEQSLFEIEFSPDGYTFSKIGSVQSKNTASGADYEFAYTPVNDRGYYRLRQVDRSGQGVYSHDIFAATSCITKGKISVYPNPVSADRKLVVNISGYSGKISGELFDAMGRKVQGYSLVNNINELSVSSLSAGSYLLYVRDENGAVQSFKVIVTR